MLNKRLAGVTVIAALLFVFFLESPYAVRGQGIGVYRGRQGRRVGRITLPTPPFNPNAGILGDSGRRGHGAPKSASHRTTRRGITAANRNPSPQTSRKRMVRRGRNTHPRVLRKSVSNRQ